MSVNIGIIGLDNSGKTSLFRALTHGIQASGRSNMATVPVPDERLQVLTDMCHPKRTVPTGIQFVDVGGINRGAAESGGLGAQFLSNLQGVDALAVVVRFYSRPDLGMGPEPAAPFEDLEGILLELGLSDLSRIERRLERTAKAARSGDQAAKREEEALRKIHERLDAGLPARGVELAASDLEAIKDLGLLTLKPMIYVANVAEDDLGPALDQELPDPNGVRDTLNRLRDFAGERSAEVAIVSAATEAELGDLPEEDAREYLESLGVTETGMARFVKTAYDLLGLLTFLTAGEPEVRAWTVRQGAKAPEAAGSIHSDIERGFIRAEVTAWSDLVEAGSPEAAKRAGKTRLEGKDYVMHEGDVVYFRFNV
jgi:GTP-binding protein YchF